MLASEPCTHTHAPPRAIIILVVIVCGGGVVVVVTRALCLSLLSERASFSSCAAAGACGCGADARGGGGGARQLRAAPSGKGGRVKETRGQLTLFDSATAFAIACRSFASAVPWT